MDADAIITAIETRDDQIRLLERELVEATQTLARVVASVGGRVVMPQHYWTRDYEIVRYEDKHQYNTIFAAREVKRARKPERKGAGQ